MKYKLKQFKLNKQSLKRKLNKLERTNKINKVRDLLNRKGTIYDVSEIKFIIENIYKNDIINKDEPLSIYYSKYNKKKYNDLMDMIEILEKNNVDEKINKDVKKLYKNTYNLIMDYDVLIMEMNRIALKYSVKVKMIEDKFNKFEEEDLKNKKII